MGVYESAEVLRGILHKQNWFANSTPVQTEVLGSHYCHVSVVSKVAALPFQAVRLHSVPRGTTGKVTTLRQTDSWSSLTPSPKLTQLWCHVRVLHWGTWCQTLEHSI